MVLGGLEDGGWGCDLAVDCDLCFYRLCLFDRVELWCDYPQN